MTDRYWRVNASSAYGCRDCGVRVSHVDIHDAFHDRIDRLVAVLLQRDREGMLKVDAQPSISDSGVQGSGNPDTPPSAENPDKPLQCAVCGEPVEEWRGAYLHADGTTRNHRATLTLPERAETYQGEFADGYAAALCDAVEAVKALPAKDQHDDDGFISLCFDKGEAVATIEALQVDTPTQELNEHINLLCAVCLQPLSGRKSGDSYRCDNCRMWRGAIEALGGATEPTDTGWSSGFWDGRKR